MQKFKVYRACKVAQIQPRLAAYSAQPVNKRVSVHIQNARRSRNVKPAI